MEANLKIAGVIEKSLLWTSFRHILTAKTYIQYHTILYNTHTPAASILQYIICIYTPAVSTAKCHKNPPVSTTIEGVMVDMKLS